MQNLSVVSQHTSSPSVLNQESEVQKYISTSTLQQSSLASMVHGDEVKNKRAEAKSDVNASTKKSLVTRIVNGILWLPRTILKGISYVLGGCLSCLGIRKPASSTTAVPTQTQSLPVDNSLSTTARHDAYLKLLADYPAVLGPLGDASKGEIEIVTDRNKIEEIEKAKNQKVGILGETAWQLWICDAVKFPDGNFGIYTRILWKQALKGPSGAAVLPILPDGKILMMCIYRHPLRKWVIEIPRGNASGVEQIKAIAKRELKEETGAEVSKLEVLGKFNADSGLTTGGVSLVQATISKFGSTQRDSAEASVTLQPFTRDDLEKAILRGHAIVKINGKDEQVEIGTDSFTLGALYLEELRKKHPDLAA